MTGSVTLSSRGGGMVLHRALLHEVDALARFQRQRHVLLHQQDRHALLVQDGDDLPDLRDHARHQALGRLVEQDDLGLQHHGPGDGEHLLLAARQRAAGLVAPLGQHREVGEDLVQQLRPSGVAHPAAVEAGAQVLHHGQQLEDAPVLRHVADAEPRQPVRRLAGDVAALEGDAALARRDQAHDGLERGALADAVAARAGPPPRRGPTSSETPKQDVALAVVGVDALDRRRGAAAVSAGALMS